jgi:hypothetical protein
LLHPGDSKGNLGARGAERLSPEEFDKHFGHLPTDGER